MKVAVFTDTYFPQINGVTNTLKKLIEYYIAVGNETLRSSLGITNKIALLYVGRISCEKDLDTLSVSYHKIQRTYQQQVAMIITGDGPYMGKCKQLFPEDTIFTGIKTGKALSELYASCDIFVCPSSTIPLVM